MPSKTATLIFRAQSGNVDATVERIGDRLEKLEERFSKFKEQATIAFAIDKVPELFEWMYEGIKKVVEVGDHFHNLAADTGVAVDQIVVLEEEFRAAGKSAEALPEIFGHMQRVLADGTQDTVIGDLGVNLQELRNKIPIDQFYEMGKAIDGLANSDDRAAAAEAIFGKAGASMLSMFHEQGFGDAAARVGEQAQILNEDAGLFADASVKLGAAGLKTQGFFTGVADQVVPTLMPLLDRFEKFDAAQSGKNAGGFVNALTQGNPAQTIVASLLTAASQFVEFLVDGILSAAGNFGLLMENIALAFTAELLHGLASFLEKASRVRGLGFLGTAARNADDFATGIDQKVEKQNQQFGWIHSGLMDGVTDQFQAALSEDVGSALDEASASHAEELAKHPELASNQGAPELQLSQPNVSHLASIGGAYGSFQGSDPLLEANAIARDHTALLQQIAGNTAKSTPSAPRAPAKHPE